MGTSNTASFVICKVSVAGGTKAFLRASLPLAILGKMVEMAGRVKSAARSVLTSCYIS